MTKLKDLTGKTFGLLYVIRRVSNYQTNARWLCRCSCGNETNVTGTQLSSGYIKSCGCFRREVRRELNSRVNTFDIVGDVVTAKDAQGKSFKFDLDDLPKVKQYYWGLNPRGYVNNSKHRLLLHRFILGATKDEVVDHINHDTSDNRKSNLRVCSHSDNMKNSRRYSSNTSGRTGVYKYRDRWRALITIDGKIIHLGLFLTFADACKAREEAEDKYFGAFNNAKK